MMHYIILTQGEYDDYDIRGLYACDHAVDPQEWDALLDQFNKDQELAGKKIYEDHGGKWGWGHIPAAHNEWIKWLDDNHPWPAFAEKHGLVKLEHTKLWTWG